MNVDPNFEKLFRFDDDMAAGPMPPIATTKTPAEYEAQIRATAEALSKTALPQVSWEVNEALGLADLPSVDDADAELAKLDAQLTKSWGGGSDSDSDNPRHPVDGGPLEKTYSHERRKLVMREWVSTELAKGRTVAELADYAQPRNPEIAQLIRDVGDEIEKGVR